MQMGIRFGNRRDGRRDSGGHGKRLSLWSGLMGHGIAVLAGGVIGFAALMPSALAEPVAMQVVGGDVRQVMLSLARMGNLSLVMDDDVKGEVTVNMTAEPEAIMRLVAASKGLALVRAEGGLLVTTREKADRLRTAHVYTVRYANPNDLAEAAKLSLFGEGMKSKAANNKTKASETSAKDKDAKDASAALDLADRNRIRVDTATNAIVLFGTAEEARTVESLVRRLDVPAQQVAIEAKVIALSKDATKKLGIEWAWSSLPQYPESESTYHSVGTTRETRETKVKRHYEGKDYIPGIIQFGHGPEGRPFEFYYETTLRALVTDGKASVLARPNITTVQGREAVISIGGEVPVPTRSVADSVTTTTYEYKKAGIILRCLPRVGADGTITATIRTEVSSPYYVEDMKAYRFQERSADTTVRLKDGETMVIGGLIGSEESHAVSKIPFLGDLPILGAFFRSVQSSKTDSEVMIFLTAHVLK